jgi:hypothetical protein
MDALFSFLASFAGRIVRAVAGLALVLIGVFLVGGVGRWILVIVGLVPLLAGLFDFCVFAPLAGLSFMGPRLRDELREE